MKTSIFVDGANMFYAQKAFGWFFDPAKLKRALLGDDELVNAFWFIGVKEPVDPPDKRFHDFLAASGYVVRTKKIKTIWDIQSRSEIQKCNLDIEIVIDMFNTIRNYEKAILVSGDGDFTRALELLRSSGKIITVVSTRKSVAGDLLQVVGSNFIDLADLRPQVERFSEKV
jgi:uncharacterized LabA/DUF88 family protein